MKKIYSNVNANKLHDEFNKSRIYPYPVLIFDNGDAEFTFSEDTDMNMVQVIVDNHNPIAVQSKSTEIEYLLELDFRISLIELGLKGEII